MIKALLKLYMMLSTQKNDRSKTKLFFWAFLIAIILGALCYTSYFFINTHIGSSASLAITTYVFIAGEILLAFIVMDKYEKLSNPPIDTSVILQSAFQHVMKKENIMSVATISVLAIASFMLFKSESKFFKKGL